MKQTLITELEKKVKDCNNTNTIFDTRKYVLLDDVKNALEKAIIYIPCCEMLPHDCVKGMYQNAHCPNIDKCSKCRNR